MNGKVIINQELCKGCGLCAVVCPNQLLSLNKSIMNDKGYNPMAITQQETCIACAMCAVMCPDSVITVKKG